MWGGAVRGESHSVPGHGPAVLRPGPLGQRRVRDLADERIDRDDVDVDRVDIIVFGKVLAEADVDNTEVWRGYGEGVERVPMARVSKVGIRVR